jgi:hypothetical protein
MLHVAMTLEIPRKLAIALLAVALALPLGTVLCLHGGGHASIELAGFARCADRHDAADHDRSSHRASGAEGADAPCVDTFVDAGELKTTTASDAGLLVLAAAPALAMPRLPSIVLDPTMIALRESSTTSRWVAASDAARRDPIALC